MGRIDELLLMSKRELTRTGVIQSLTDKYLIW
jgi:hypothetical protein